MSIINLHEEILLSWLDQYLQDQTKSPLERLRSFFQFMLGQMANNHFIGGCPLGNLAQEMSDQNKAFRIKLKEVTIRVKEKIAACLEEAQQQKQLRESIDVHEYAAFIFHSWQGSLLITKVEKSSQALAIFEKTVFEILLKL